MNVYDNNDNLLLLFGGLSASQPCVLLVRVCMHERSCKPHGQVGIGQHTWELELGWILRGVRFRYVLVEKRSTGS